MLPAVVDIQPVYPVQPVYMVDEEPPDVQLIQPAAQPVEEEHTVPVQSMLLAVVDVELVQPFDVQPHQPAVVNVKAVCL